jgi:hypothetical protein
VEPDIKSRAESALRNIKMNENKFIGVIAEEPTACYAGIIQRIHTEANTDKTQVVLFATTVIKNKRIGVYRYTVYDSPDRVTDMLAQLKTSVAALYAANR